MKNNIYTKCTKTYNKNHGKEQLTEYGKCVQQVA